MKSFSGLALVVFLAATFAASAGQPATKVVGKTLSSYLKDAATIVMGGDYPSLTIKDQQQVKSIIALLQPDQTLTETLPKCKANWTMTFLDKSDKKLGIANICAPKGDWAWSYSFSSANAEEGTGGFAVKSSESMKLDALLTTMTMDSW